MDRYPFLSSCGMSLANRSPRTLAVSFSHDRFFRLYTLDMVGCVQKLLRSSTPRRCNFIQIPPLSPFLYDWRENAASTLAKLRKLAHTENVLHDRPWDFQQWNFTQAPREQELEGRKNPARWPGFGLMVVN